jgi:hypothetical protein
MMSSVANTVSQAWLQGVGHSERRSNGRAMLEHISKELREAVLANKGQGQAAASPANLQFIANMPAPANTPLETPTLDPTYIPTQYLCPHALFWQAPIASDTTNGNMAEIGYFVEWDRTSTPGVALGTMRRFFVNPTQYGTTSPYLIYATASATSTNPINWLSTSVVDPVTTATSPSYSGWFADNVIAFWVRCLDSSGSVIPPAATGDQYGVSAPLGFDSRAGYKDSAGNFHPGPVLPGAVELAIVTVDSRTAKLISAPITATPSKIVTQTSFGTDIIAFMNGLPANVKTGAQLFTTTVDIPVQ